MSKRPLEERLPGIVKDLERKIRKEKGPEKKWIQKIKLEALKWLCDEL